MQIFNTLFLILCLSLSNVAFASGEITKRSLVAPAEEAKPASIYDEDNKLALAEKQIQDLLARIEVLEHAVSQLQKQSASTGAASPAIGAVISPDMINGQSDSAIISDVPGGSSEKKEYDAARKENDNIFGPFISIFKGFGEIGEMFTSPLGKSSSAKGGKGKPSGKEADTAAFDMYLAYKLYKKAHGMLSH